jgi:hypothetical protein
LSIWLLTAPHFSKILEKYWGRRFLCLTSDSNSCYMNFFSKIFYVFVYINGIWIQNLPFIAVEHCYATTDMNDHSYQFTEELFKLLWSFFRCQFTAEWFMQARLVSGYYSVYSVAANSDHPWWEWEGIHVLSLNTLLTKFLQQRYFALRKPDLQTNGCLSFFGRNKQCCRELIVTSHVYMQSQYYHFGVWTFSTLISSSSENFR